MRRVALQIAREFSIPLLTAVVWAGYDSGFFRDATAAGIIKDFSSSFFLASWLLSQYFRIRKQQKIDDNLTSIEKRVDHNLDLLKEKTEHIIGSMTGGDSFAYIMPTDIKNDMVDGLIISNKGEYPLYDLEVRILDADQIKNLPTNEIPDIDVKHHAFRGMTKYVDVLAADGGDYWSIELQLGEGSERNFTILLFARNGQVAQFLEFKKVDGNWLSATTVERDGDIIYETRPVGFPVAP